MNIPCKLEGKNVRVTTAAGQVLCGYLYQITSAEDNEPDPESILLESADGGLTEVYTRDICKITQACQE